MAELAFQHPLQARLEVEILPDRNTGLVPRDGRSRSRGDVSALTTGRRKRNRARVCSRRCRGSLSHVQDQSR